MNTNNLYIKRLLNLVTSLQILEINNQRSIKQYKAEEKNGVYIFSYVFDLIETKLKDKANGVSGLYLLAVYYKLTMDEVMHLFSIGYHEAYLGSYPLTKKSTPVQLSEHIAEFVKIKEELYEPVQVWKISRKERHYIKHLNQSSKFPTVPVLELTKTV